MYSKIAMQFVIIVTALNFQKVVHRVLTSEKSHVRKKQEKKL